MDKQNTPGTQPTLEEIKDKLENWRKTKISIREPIPQKLWQQAVELSKKHSVSSMSFCTPSVPGLLQHLCTTQNYS